MKILFLLVILLFLVSIFQKTLSPYMSFNIGYNYIFDVESQEGISELQSYSLKSHTVFVGASFDLSLLNQQSQTQEVDVVEKKLVEMERSYSNVKLDFDNLKLYVDSLFAAESNLNSKLSFLIL